LSATEYATGENSAKSNLQNLQQKTALCTFGTKIFKTKAIAEYRGTDWLTQGTNWLITGMAGKCQETNAKMNKPGMVAGLLCS
jgi:hypothetical protein